MHPPLTAARRLAQPPRPGFKSGGLIRGPGTGTSDSIPAEVPEGTFIMPADSTQSLGLASAALGGGVPVNLSNGEYEVTPEQVQEIGTSVLDILRGVTHQPVEQEAELAPQGFADGGVVEDERRNALVGHIPVGGLKAPPADGSQSSVLNTEVGRNALNTLSALPGTGGLASRAGGGVARAASGALSTERVIPAAWEVVQEGGAVARGGATAAQQLGQLGGASGGALSRAATLVPETSAMGLPGRAAQMLGAPSPGGQLVQRGGSQVAEGVPGMAGRARVATQYADVVEPAALAAPQAGQAAQAVAGGKQGLGLGRMAAVGAGVGGAALLGTALSGARPDETGFGLPSATAATQAGAPDRPGALAAPSGPVITRDGNSYTGPSGIRGEVPIQNADGSSRAAAALSSVPQGPVSAQNMAAADALAGRQEGESLARLGISAGRGQAPGFTGVIGQSVDNGNMWSRTPAQQRRDAEVSVSSIHRNTAANGVAALQALNVQDLQEARNRGALDVAETQVQGDLARTAVADAGATQRADMQERGLNLRQVIAARQSGNAPTGYRWSGAGGLEPIPGGPADPNVRGARAPLNDVQSKALQFGTRMQTSGQLLDELAAQGVSQPGLLKRGADAVGLGGAANWTQSGPQQQVEQAQRDFINAVLRRESGAAIADTEFANARQQYFPQPGDDPKVIEQKRRNREIATNGVLAEVPDAEKRVNQVLSGSPVTPGSPGTAPALAPAPAPAAASVTPPAGGSVQVTDAASYQALPAGALYTTPSGEVRRKK